MTHIEAHKIQHSINTLVIAPNLQGILTSYYYEIKGASLNTTFYYTYFHAYILIHVHCHFGELPSQTLGILII